MRLESVTIENFRNHKYLEFEPGRSITNIYGKNGSGKTSILESIHYSALTKGFNGTTDHECLTFGEDFFTIRSVFKGNNENQSNVIVTYGKGKEKKIYLNDQEIKTFSSHIGVIPCVTFTPKDMVFVHGSPIERRRFIDTTISQSDRKYLKNLIQNRRILQQRNALLSQYREGKDNTTLELLTQQFIKISAEIVDERIRFSKQFSLMLNQIYKWYPEEKKPEIKYFSTHGNYEKTEKKGDIEEIYNRNYKLLKNKEIIRGVTLFGPHRDDLLMSLDDKEIKKYSSQGQQRAFLVAIKITMITYLKIYTGEHPVCLFDDIFSELDEKIQEKILEALYENGQIIMTNTNKKDGYGIINISAER